MHLPAVSGQATMHSPILDLLNNRTPHAIPVYHFVAINSSSDISMYRLTQPKGTEAVNKAIWRLNRPLEFHGTNKMASVCYRYIGLNDN